MPLCRILVLLLVLNAATFSFAYEVVLKNGKLLTGEVVNENEEVMILRDSSGVKLNIKKNNIDWSKTRERNKKTEEVQRDVAKPPAKTGTRAGEPKKKARVYKKEDLEKMPELTIIGSKEKPDDVALRNESNELSMQEQEAEAAWNEAALQINDQIRAAQESYESNKSFCDKVVPDLQDLPAGVYTPLTAEQYEERRRVACMEAEAAAKALEEAEAEYEELLEDARKKGIPPGWVDPDRIRN